MADPVGTVEEDPRPTNPYHYGMKVPPAFRSETAREIHLAVTVVNRSSLDWAPFEQSGIALGNHWLTADGEILVWSDGRTPLPETLPIGSTIALALAVMTPSRPGDYLLELDMVEEGVTWFAEKRAPSRYVPVSVVEHSPGAEVEPVRLAPRDSSRQRTIRGLKRDVERLTGWRKPLARWTLALTRHLARRGAGPRRRE